ncbi:conserved hypothetical protein [Bosea sp. 62]|uniref:hypothetical protein n=1 Tax=unclassified Bosea (in: a-proteobacteria) TaxID=2653178 RepID=UPI001254AE6E|nr:MULTISPECIES: hypothetical protein [unclassified Bosea (in: a-proteobacteria)]CAD5259023.1 conserved hypothetical protein [Bosea sp. 46]CAD5263440.1 conserved hypothetical protein [Bosea sp. 21B]CAD5276854.1 conserved hypothetical protein [Bosea sp. 7B]VVT58986.1 conserved hypothetical protein [Bosea sp. EC-HK365B]VXB64518.1 conserved hypothetical protein [Bosea sp. 29B]
MRVAILGMLLGVAAMGEAAAEWKPSIFDGESKRAIQGCSATMTDDAWSCAFIRCEANKSLGLYLDIPGVLSEGPITLAIDGRDFQLALQSTGGPFGDAYRVAGADAEMFAAFPTGRSLRIRQEGIKKGYDSIPLAGIGPALRRLSQSCGQR